MLQFIIGFAMQLVLKLYIPFTGYCLPKELTAYFLRVPLNSDDLL